MQLHSGRRFKWLSPIPGSGAVRYLNPFGFRQRGPRSKALFALSLVCVFWGTSWVASRQGVMHMPALQLAGIRQFVAGFLFVGFFLLKGLRLPRGKEWLPILVLSFLNFIVANGLSTWGVKYIGAGLGSIIGAIFPLWLVLIGWVSSGTRLKRKAYVGLLTGFAGICIIFYEHLHNFLKPEFRFGIAISILATWSWAFGTLYTKKQAAYFNPYFGLGLQMLLAGVFLLAVSFFTGQSVAVMNIPWQAWGAIAYLVAVGSIVTFVAYLYALQNLPTEQVSIYAYINPIVAVLIGALLFSEVLTVFIIAGVLITLYGVYLVKKSVKAIT